MCLKTFFPPFSGDESRPRETEAEQEGGDDSEPTIITVQADVHEPPETSIGTRFTSLLPLLS